MSGSRFRSLPAEGGRRRSVAHRLAARGRDTGRLPVTQPLPRRIWHEFRSDDVANEAAKVAVWLTTKLQSVLPAGAGALVDDFVTEVARNEHPGLLSFGVLATLWAASNVMMALEDSLNDAYDVPSERSFVRRRLLALGMLLAVGLLFLGGSGTLLAGPAVSDALGAGSAGAAVWKVARWPLAFGVITAAFWLLYYFLPNRDQSACRLTLLKGSAVAAAIWILVTVAFRVYISNFGSYGATYGVLGTVIVLLFWMYLTSMVILLGGEISSEMERRA
jgi:membrane protein